MNINDIEIGKTYSVKSNHTEQIAMAVVIDVDYEKAMIHLREVGGFGSFASKSHLLA